MIRLSTTLCPILGHRSDRTKAWHDNLDWRAPCIRCGAPMIKSGGRGWRAFGTQDFSIDRRGVDDAFKPLPPVPGGSRIDQARTVREPADPAIVSAALAILAANPHFNAIVAAKIRNPASRAIISAACRQAAAGRRVSSATVAAVTTSLYNPSQPALPVLPDSTLDTATAERVGNAGE